VNVGIHIVRRTTLNSLYFSLLYSFLHCLVKFDADRGLLVSKEVVSTLNRAEANRHGAGRMRFVRSADTRCDPIDISQECCVQHHEREHNRRFDEGIVKYV